MSEYKIYESIIKSYCSDWRMYKKKFGLETDSPIINAFIFATKEEFTEYQRVIQKSQTEEIIQEGEMYLFFLEGKICYYLGANSKNFLSKKDDLIKEEFIQLCRKALTVFPFAFFASRSLSHVLEKQHRFTESFDLINNIWNHGFRTNGILISLIYYSMVNKDWKKVEKFSNLIAQPLNKAFTLLTYYGVRFHLNKIVIAMIGITILYWQYWLIVASVFAVLCTFVVVFGILLKNRVILAAYSSVLIQFGLIILLRLVIDFLWN
jgi:hypothetical protein